LDIAEENKAKRVYVCIRINSSELGNTIRTLMLIGFKALDQEEQMEVSKTKTHLMFGYDLNDD